MTSFFNFVSKNLIFTEKIYLKNFRNKLSIKNFFIFLLFLVYCLNVVNLPKSCLYRYNKTLKVKIVQ